MRAEGRTSRRHVRSLKSAILAVGCVGLAACASSGIEADSPDAILTGDIITLDAERPRVEALAVTHGRIVAVGTRVEVEALAGEATRLVEIPGVAVPGWTDAHTHPTTVTPRSDTLYLLGMTKPEILDAVREAVRDTPPGEWITGRGWDESLWDPPTFGTAADLDAISGEHPMRLSRTGGHGSWVNSMALELADITRDTPDPPGGEIVRDENGDALGFLVDRAEGLLPELPERPDADSDKDRLRAGLQQYARWGATGLHDVDGTWEMISAYKEMQAADELPVRAYVMTRGDQATEHLLENGPEIDIGGNGMLTIRSIKLFLDGSMGSRGAALSEPYTDDPGTRGVDMTTEEELDRIIRTAVEMGVQVSPHVIGDRAVTRALDAATRGGVTPADRFRLEHASIVRPDDVERIAHLGVIPSMQGNFIGLYSRIGPQRLGPERAAWVKPVRDLMDAGITIAHGTDLTVPPRDGENPLVDLLSQLVIRDWYPKNALSVDEALRGMTIDPAFASFQEEDLGPLTVGRYADLTVLSADPYEVLPQELANLGVLMTVVGGRVVFDARVP